VTPRTLRLGSLCSGYGGLDLAAEQVLGAEAAWHCQYDPADKHQYAARILARHWDVPNHGDITAVDWTRVEPVDVLTAGFPCQDVSSAGKRAGIAPGTRSGLWAHVARAIDALHPSVVLIENVRGLLSARAHSHMEPCTWCLGDSDRKPALRALGAVLGDLATLGFDAEWQGLPASSVGAAHARFRVFVLAWPADTPRPRLQGHRLPGRHAGTDRLGGQRDRARDGRRHEPAPHRLPAPHTQGLGEREPADQTLALAGGRDARPVTRGGGLLPAPHTQGDGRHQGRAEPARQQRRPDTPLRGGGTAAHPQGERFGDTRPPGLGGLPPAPVAGRPAPAADPDRSALRQQPLNELRGGGAPLARHPGPGTAADPDGGGREGRAAGHRGEPALTLADADGPDVAWGPYTAAVHRWAAVLGRPAPAPTDAQGRLAPVFVEWLMGLPPGWVTDTPSLPRSAQLKALGNGVVPQQAAAALRHLLDRADLPQPLTGPDTRSAA
jgi:DNA (cytosine-5)-methyltransferase 1